MSDVVELPPELALAEIAGLFYFRRRPHPVAPDLRPEWRIALVLLLLKNCCRRKASLARLHLLSWSTLSVVNRQRLESVLAGNLAPETVLLRFEQFLIQAIALGVAEGLLDGTDPARVSLSPAGVALATRIEAVPGLMVSERDFMKRLGASVTEAFVKRMMEGK